MAVRFARQGTEIIKDHKDLINIGKRTHEELDYIADEVEASRGEFASLDDRLLDIDFNISNLDILGIKAIADTYADLVNIGDKEIGFYLVKTDETYRNNPTHYYYNGVDFKLVGGKLPNGALKKTVVFYMKRYNNVGQNIRLYVPYKGYISSVTSCIPTNNNIKFNLYDRLNLIDEFEVNSTFMKWDVFYSIENPILKVEIKEGETGVENININVDIIIE